MLDTVGISDSLKIYIFDSYPEKLNYFLNKMASKGWYQFIDEPID